MCGADAASRSPRLLLSGQPESWTRCVRRWPGKRQASLNLDLRDRQKTKGDRVFSKPLRVLGHVECFEPVRDLLHCGPSRRFIELDRASGPWRQIVYPTN